MERNERALSLQESAEFKEWLRRPGSEKLYQEMKAISGKLEVLQGVPQLRDAAEQLLLRLREEKHGREKRREP